MGRSSGTAGQQPAARLFETLFERRAAIALPEIRQETRRRVDEDQARERGRQEILLEKIRGASGRPIAGFPAASRSRRARVSAASNAAAPTLPPETPLMAKR